MPARAGDVDEGPRLTVAHSIADPTDDVDTHVRVARLTPQDGDAVLDVARVRLGVSCGT